MWCPRGVSHKAEQREHPLLTLLPVVQPRIHSAFWAVSAQCRLMSHLSPTSTPRHFPQGCSQPIHSLAVPGLGAVPTQVQDLAFGMVEPPTFPLPHHLPGRKTANATHQLLPASPSFPKPPQPIHSHVPSWVEGQSFPGIVAPILLPSLDEFQEHQSLWGHLAPPGSLPGLCAERWLQGAAVTTGSPTRPPMIPGVKVESGEKEGERRKKTTKPFECNILVEHQSMSKGGSFSWSGEFKL